MYTDAGAVTASSSSSFPSDAGQEEADFFYTKHETGIEI
jgi:hypothetical protein